MSQLNRIRTRFLLLILVGLLIAPLTGLTAALLYGLVSIDALQATRTLIVMGLFTLGFTTLAAIYFSRYFSPLPSSAALSGQRLPNYLQHRLAHFGRDYWTCYLVYALAIPPLLFLATRQPLMAEPGPQV